MIIKEKGFFYIRKLKHGFAVYYETHELNSKSQIKIEKHQWIEFGFKPDMSIEHAKSRCTQLNKERNAVKKRLRAEQRAVGKVLVANVYFPKNLAEQFIVYLTDNNLGSDTHLAKVLTHFTFVQNMITELGLLPNNYADNSKKIYKYLIQRRVSVDYANKLVAMLNRYGVWFSKTTQSYYQPVPKPRGNERYRIEEAQETKIGVNSRRGVRMASEALTPELLEASGLQLKDRKLYNWLMISLWFGLRPNEIQTDNYKVLSDISGVKVLCILMTKVLGKKERRTKNIPILFDQQKKALGYLTSGEYKFPSAITVRKYLGDGYTTYAGRKGFADLMLSLDQKFEHITIWLGHKDISTTFKSYKRKDIVQFTSVKKKA